MKGMAARFALSGLLLMVASGSLFAQEKTLPTLGGVSWSEIIANGIVTLVAAFGGAFFAFLLERRARHAEQMAANIAAGNRALFTLTQVWNKLAQYRKEVIEPFRGKADAWLNMPQSASIVDASVTFDPKELTFLLDKKPSVFQTLMLEADRFQHVAAMIDRRNDLIHTNVATRLPLEAQLTDAQLSEALGDYTVLRLKVYADGLTSMVDQDMASSQAAFEALRNALKELYPSKKMISFDFLEK